MAVGTKTNIIVSVARSEYFVMKGVNKNEQKHTI